MQTTGGAFGRLEHRRSSREWLLEDDNTELILYFAPPKGFIYPQQPDLSSLHSEKQVSKTLSSLTTFNFPSKPIEDSSAPLDPSLSSQHNVKLPPDETTTATAAAAAAAEEEETTPETKQIPLPSPEDESIEGSESLSSATTAAAAAAAAAAEESSLEFPPASQGEENDLNRGGSSSSDKLTPAESELLKGQQIFSLPS